MMDAERFNSLLRQMDIGNESVLAIIQKEYGKQIMWVAYSILKDWHHTKAILNDVLIRLWNKSKKFRNIKNPGACIYDLARKASYSYYRRYLKKHENETGFDCVKKNEAARHLVHIDDHSAIDFDEIISDLDDIEKEIIIKKIVFCFTHAQIANDLSMPEGTVKWKYQYILENLHKKMKKE